MSLPREPRQKMINMMYLVLTALLALNVSSEILNAFKTVNKSLEATNLIVNNSTNTLMKSLDEKRKDPATSTRAELWYPRAQKVQEKSDELYNHIQHLKNSIIVAAGGDSVDASKSYKEDNLEIATHLMITKGKGQELLKMLTKYKADILAIDPAIDSAFKTTLPINLEKPDSKNRSGRTWDGAYFHMVPTVAGLTILSKFQMDVRTAENRVVQFCHNKVGEVNIVFDSYSPFIAQNSNYLMPGQDLEAHIGVGAFSTKAKPTIVVGGNTLEVDGTTGLATYKVPGGSIGEHSITVQVSYINQETGKMMTVPETIKYTVGQANASIALDKMNVLYIGVDNPVSIAASGGGDDKVKPTITGGGGSLIKTGAGKYSARVNSVTDDCIITVYVDGKPAGASKFRVRTVPQAQAMVGGHPSGDPITAGAFKAQGGVGAGIKDFPFELSYQVVSFTFTCDTDAGDIVSVNSNTNAFAGPVRDAIQKEVKAGKMVTIENVRVKGPDGRVSPAPSLLYYIK
jgi:gliding motility-associated protein GldM